VPMVLSRCLRIRLYEFGKSGGVWRATQVLRSRELDGSRKSDKIRRVSVQRLQRLFSQAARRVGAEQMRAAVNRVHRLPIASWPGITRCERFMRPLERRENILE